MDYFICVSFMSGVLGFQAMLLDEVWLFFCLLHRTGSSKQQPFRVMSLVMFFTKPSNQVRSIYAVVKLSMTSAVTLPLIPWCQEIQRNSIPLSLARHLSVRHSKVKFVSQIMFCESVRAQCCRSILSYGLTFFSCKSLVHCLFVHS